MHIGSHWGLWALAIVALIVGVFLILRSRRNKKWNWAAAGVLALILAVSMSARGWIVWPKQTAQHFISVVYDGSSDEVMAMLSEPGQWTITDDGGVTILAEDSTKVTLSPDDLPLMAASAEVGGVPIPGQVIGEVLAGKLISPSARARRESASSIAQRKEGACAFGMSNCLIPNPRKL